MMMEHHQIWLYQFSQALTRWIVEAVGVIVSLLSSHKLGVPRIFWDRHWQSVKCFASAKVVHHRVSVADRSFLWISGKSVCEKLRWYLCVVSEHVSFMSKRLWMSRHITVNSQHAWIKNQHWWIRNQTYENESILLTFQSYWWVTWLQARLQVQTSLLWSLKRSLPGTVAFSIALTTWDIIFEMPVKHAYSCLILKSRVLAHK